MKNKFKWKIAVTTVSPWAAMTNTSDHPPSTLLTPSDPKLRFNTCKSFWLSDLSHPKHTRAARRDKTYSFNSVVFRSVINSRFVFRGVFLLWAFTSALYITCLINGCVVFSLKSPRVSAFKLFFIKFIRSNRTALAGVLFSRFNPRFAAESSISCYISSPSTLFSVLCSEWRFEVMRYWALRNRFL